MPGARTMLDELESLRGIYAPLIARRKGMLLRSILQEDIRSPQLLARLHATALYMCAFPDDAIVLSSAESVLAGWPKRVAGLTRRQRVSLDDSGMAGTPICHEFSYAITCQLVERFQNAIDINWDEYEEPDRLDELLCRLIGPAEEQAFEDGDITTQSWIRLAKGQQNVSDLVWLLRQSRRPKALHASAETMYGDAEVPVRWQLGEAAGSTTFNAFPIGDVVYRSAMRKPPQRPKVAIAQMLRGIELLGEAPGRAMIDVAAAALAARHREVFAITHANPAEVYLAPLGGGTHAAIMGVEPQRRLHLEGHYGYILLANGRPIGYGGVSPLFRQGNTGINIFAEYRKSEGAFLFTQLLRTFHTLFGITRFLANPYQFGRGNSEAVNSGAFWFYYRLGFRPVDTGAAALARDEYRRIRSQRGYRSDRATLRRLAKSDFHLTLPGARMDELFEEPWLAICALRATAAIAAQPGADRATQRKRIADQVATSLRISDRATWSKAERLSLEHLAPTICLAGNLDRWRPAEIRSLVKLIRAKCAMQERDYVLTLGKHTRLRKSLARVCRRHG